MCESLELYSQPHGFLPHHGVLKSNKNRVILDASVSTSTSVTNRILHQGSKLHNDVQDKGLQFREHKIVFSCDIRQIFRMANAIRWYTGGENSFQPLQVYQLATVCFSMSSSPFITNWIMQQLIMDEGNKYQLAV